MVEENDSPLHYNVKVPIERVTLSPKGIACLGIECFATEIKATKKYITLYFDEKDKAQAFLTIINSHARP